MQLLCEEFSIDHFRGMQLAFTRLPAVPLDQASKEDQKVKSKNSSTPVKPSAVPVTKPLAPPESKTPPTVEVKPVQVSPVKQPITPAQAAGAQNNLTQDKVRAPSVVANREARMQWIAGIGFDNGGAELGVLSFANGSVTSIKANKGYFFNIGVVFPTVKGTDLSTQLTIGYKIGGVKGGNGSVIWSALPIEALEYYNMRGIRMGLGLSYQLKPKLEIKIPGSNSVDQYNNALGLIAQLGWAPFAAAYSIDLRYTSIKYQQSIAPNAPSVDGSSVGIYASYSF
jgi:hypothetical protein